jgi:hypothetical protein
MFNDAKYNVTISYIFNGVLITSMCLRIRYTQSHFPVLVKAVYMAPKWLILYNLLSWIKNVPM